MTNYTIIDWQAGYSSQYEEYDYWIDEIEGEIPIELNGTLFRNGPGLLDVHGFSIHHPFDGDGMISRFSFCNGKAHYKSRYVQTEGYVKEQAAKKILYRGVFGTQKPGGWIKNIFDINLKNIANTNIVYWGKRLLALWEADKPYELDPITLETIGISDLDGVLKKSDAFAAHPHIDPSGPTLVNFAIKAGLKTRLSVYEFNEQGELTSFHHHNIPGFCFIHDFIITPNYCIFLQNPVTLNPIPFVFGLRGAGECIEFNPQDSTKIILIPRKLPYDEIQVLEVKAGFVFHHANAYETTDGICLDSICYEYLPSVEPNSDFRNTDFSLLAPGQLWRFDLNLGNKTVDKTLLEASCSEFPTLNSKYIGKKYRYVYTGNADSKDCNAPLQQILKIDLLRGQKSVVSFAPRGFVSEPIFVKKPEGVEEDEGWLLTLVYNAARSASDLVIIDAQTMEIVATLKLKHHIPYGLHGSWVDECFITV